MKKQFLHKSEFLSYAPEVPGEQVHVHHCKQGRNNDRMYVKRNNDGTVIAYCHHCGKTGLYKDDSFVKNIRNSNTYKKDSKIPELPADIVVNVRNWDKTTKLKLLGYGLTIKDLQRNNVLYCKSTRETIFPVLDKDNNYIGYISRDYSTDSTNKLKYNKRYCTERYSPLILKPDKDNYNNKIIVLVEDYISGIRCSKYYDTVILMGTTLSKETKNKILNNGYERAIIFLDNDNSIVKNKALSMKQFLGTVLFEGASIVRTNKDPKDYSEEELKKVLEEHANE